jgi:hypothetical protein
MNEIYEWNLNSAVENLFVFRKVLHGAGIKYLTFYQMGLTGLTNKKLSLTFRNRASYI